METSPLGRQLVPLTRLAPIHTGGSQIADAGSDPLELYQPWFLMDQLQQSLMTIHEARRAFSPGKGISVESLVEQIHGKTRVLLVWEK